MIARRNPGNCGSVNARESGKWWDNWDMMKQRRHEDMMRHRGPDVTTETWWDNCDMMRQWISDGTMETWRDHDASRIMEPGATGAHCCRAPVRRPWAHWAGWWAACGAGWAASGTRTCARCPAGSKGLPSRTQRRSPLTPVWPVLLKPVLHWSQGLLCLPSDWSAWLSSSVQPYGPIRGGQRGSWVDLGTNVIPA